MISLLFSHNNLINNHLIRINFYSHLINYQINIPILSLNQITSSIIHKTSILINNLKHFYKYPKNKNPIKLYSQNKSNPRIITHHL
jgi:hypothetical protein